MFQPVKKTTAITQLSAIGGGEANIGGGEANIGGGEANIGGGEAN